MSCSEGDGGRTEKEPMFMLGVIAELPTVEVENGPTVSGSEPLQHVLKPQGLLEVIPTAVPS